MAPPTLDQIMNFLAVVEHGSFSAAARARKRAQPAITYSIQKLESDIGVRLFDRSGFRPNLTADGRLLLQHARRIAEEVGLFSLQSQGIAAGLEEELSVVVDPICSAAFIVEPLVTFQQLYPSVRILLYADVLDGVVKHLLADTCTIGITSMYADMTPKLRRQPLWNIELLLVAAPHHPLAQMPRDVPDHLLRDHIQLALMERSGAVGLRDYGILSNQLWRVTEMTMMLEMLRAGLGYGFAPQHLVREDMATGRLVQLYPQSWNISGTIELPIYAAWKANEPLGMAARWLLNHLCDRRAGSPEDP